MNWFRTWRINRLLVVRAGHQAHMRELCRCGKGNTYVAGCIGEINEKLRQLGYKETE